MFLRALFDKSPDQYYTLVFEHGEEVSGEIAAAAAAAAINSHPYVLLSRASHLAPYLDSTLL
jgi:hypothetical protein